MSSADSTTDDNLVGLLLSEPWETPSASFNRNHSEIERVNEQLGEVWAWECGLGENNDGQMRDE